MRCLYKIYSNYGGFTPRRIPHRMRDGRLSLGWSHYIDTVEIGWECWVYFHGRHAFTNGVYVRGFVDAIDLNTGSVSLRVREYSTEEPLTDSETSERVARTVSPRYRQVFLWPEEWSLAPECGLSACKGRRCADCQTWMDLPLLNPSHMNVPERLRRSHYEQLVQGHWIVPSRCYYRGPVAPAVRLMTDRFYDFKLGEMAYAYPFARAIFEQLTQTEQLEFDYVVPIPLSPDKMENGEEHRTLQLAKELGRLLAVPVREVLELRSNVSKRRMLSEGSTTVQFEKAYRSALHAEVPDDAQRLLLVDDVMTRGSTVAMALGRLYESQPTVSVVVATAGQMILRPVVEDEAGFRG